MSETNSSTSSEIWSKYAKLYDPLKIGSIDGTDTEPHDKAIIRALNSEYAANKHVKGRPECTIFVSRLNVRTTKDTIKEVFSKYGKLKRFRLVKDIVTGFPKGYAFIEYENEASAEEAYRRAYRIKIDGRVVFVDFECERLLKGWKPRRLGGGFGGNKESGQLRFGGRDRPFKKPISLEMMEKNRTEERGEGRRRRSSDRSRERGRPQTPDSEDDTTRRRRGDRRSRELNGRSRSRRRSRSRSRDCSGSRSRGPSRETTSQGR